MWQMNWTVNHLVWLSYVQTNEMTQLPLTGLLRSRASSKDWDLSISSIVMILWHLSSDSVTSSYQGKYELRESKLGY